MARNRKRAKERRARRPQPVASARTEREETPAPLAHGTPDVELAEAQLAVGRREPSDGGAEDLTDEDAEGLTDDATAPDEFDELGASALGGASVPGVVGVSPHLEQGPASGASVGDAALPATRSLPGNRLVNFLRGSWNELQRVQWPDRRQVMQATGVVIGFVIVAGVFLGVADFLGGKLVDYILK